MRPLILANYKNGTPRDLKRGLPGAKIVNPYTDKVKFQGGIILNWGTRPHLDSRSYSANILNRPEAVDKACNKQKTLMNLKAAGVPCLDWTTNVEIAIDWLKEGKSVFGRALLEGSSGDGIVLQVAKDYKKNLKDGAPTVSTEFRRCKIWTKNFPKEAEARVHVFQGRVIHYSEKRRVNPERFAQDPLFDKSLAKPDFWVRNHKNGWIFAHEILVPHQVAMQVSRDAIKALGLDFGAVDVLMAENKAVVCEVNTAPGLEGQSLKAYLQVLNSFK